jgi:hypothetical protein
MDAISNKWIRPKVSDQFFKSSAVWVKMNAMSRVNRRGGNPLTVPVVYAQNLSGGFYLGDETLNTARGKKWNAVPFDWKQYYEALGLVERDRLLQSEQGQIRMQVVEEEVCMKTMLKRLAEALYGDGTGGSYVDDLSVTRYKALDGLKPSSGSTVGGGACGVGIYPPSIGWSILNVPTWQSAGDGSGIDSTSVAISPALISKMMVNLTFQNQGPTMVATTKSLWSVLWSHLQPQQQLAVDADLAKAGFQQIMLDGKPVVFDDYCTTLYCYVLNLNGFELYIHPDRDFSNEPWTKPQTQDVVQSKKWFLGNLTCNDRRGQGVFTALAG